MKWARVAGVILLAALGIAALALAGVVWGVATVAGWVVGAGLCIAFAWLVREAVRAARADEKEWEISDATMAQLKRLQRRARMEGQ